MAAELEILNPTVKQEASKLITLEARLSELMERLDRQLHNSFNNITAGKARSEIIVLFLAMLHLLKAATIEVRQEKLFSDIKIMKNKA